MEHNDQLWHAGGPVCLCVPFHIISTEHSIQGRIQAGFHSLLNIQLDGKRTKFGQLILSKIIKIVAASCQILRLKCTKFDFGWGSAPEPAGKLIAFPQTH